jgi:hypothetical protein
MNKLISECISSSSFNRVHHKLAIRNETSHTLHNKTEDITLKELDEHSLIIELPKNICQKSHTLAIFFLESNLEKQIKIPTQGHYKEAVIEILAKVNSIEVNINNEQMVFANLNVSEVDIHKWRKIIDQYSDNQRKIDSMMFKQQGFGIK